MSRLTRDGTVEPVSRDQIFRRERGQVNIDFSRSADHEQEDWQIHTVDPYSAICDDIRTTWYVVYHHWGTQLNPMSFRTAKLTF